MGRKHLGPRHR